MNHNILMQIYFHSNRVVLLVNQVIKKDSNKEGYLMKEDSNKNRILEKKLLTSPDSEIEEPCVVKEEVLLDPINKEILHKDKKEL